MEPAEGPRDGEEEEEVEEEQLVMVELSGIIDSDFLEKCDNKCKILGIDTERPILQVDRYVFTGEYEDTLGTCVVFEEDKDHDADGNQKVQLKYKCHTMKKLNMTRTLLTEKKEGEENTGGDVEWLELKDKDFSYSRPNMICNFLHEKEEETTESQDKQAEDSDGEAGDLEDRVQNLESETHQCAEMDDSVSLLDVTGSKARNSPVKSQEDMVVDDPPS
ncbi:general transcription factor 3C polypeptide 6 isoform X2 [Anolis carolinensis]|uniref:general transcription factor 3C polypeptide 6 isoform X2 n=1 Tax=Anolis carolinensis TaxID=28377 RepID=UPI0004628EEE|nr:PREDICTED: general transcription factor 3C polypeptide 6 isoform X2 [Anolis carolinensis]|eukprot:XP_008119311.1 PREDICTED: general transcription factor 3C polypeptide 6 isoform X2 [Anolis carolinensis]